MTPEWEGYDREWRKLGGRPYEKGKNKWEFSSFHTNALNNMVFVANIYKNVLERFLATLQSRLTAANLVSEIRGYALGIEEPKTKQIRFTITVWGTEATVVVYAADPALFALIKKRLSPAAQFDCRLPGQGFWIKKQTQMDVDFLHEENGTVFCMKALSELAAIIAKAEAEAGRKSSDFIKKIIAVA